MVPSTNMNEGDLSNYVVKPILTRDKKELQGFYALQIPILKILRNVRSMDALLRSADIVVTSSVENRVEAHYQSVRHRALTDEYLRSWAFPELYETSMTSLAIAQQGLDMDKLIVNCQ